MLSSIDWVESLLVFYKSLNCGPGSSDNKKNIHKKIIKVIKLIINPKK